MKSNLSINTNIPILVITFNRPKFLKELIPSLIKIGFTNIYCSIDGPRNNIDKILVDKSINYCKKYQKNINFNLRISNKNLGCRKAVEASIDWFFRHVDKGIILEDDIRANKSFFKFAGEMLYEYKNEKNIFLIGGSNFFPDSKGKNTYYFINHAPIWGWATWKDRWLIHKKILNSLTEKELFSHRNDFTFFEFNLIKKTFFGKINTWDYLLLYTIRTTKGVSVIPSKNLIKNIGYKNGTHTKFKLFQFMVEREEMNFPLQKRSTSQSDFNISRKWNCLYMRAFLFLKTISFYVKTLF